MAGTLRAADDGFAELPGAGEARLESAGGASLGSADSVYRGFQPVQPPVEPAIAAARPGEAAPVEQAGWYPQFLSSPACPQRGGCASGGCLSGCGGDVCGDEECDDPGCGKCWFDKLFGCKKEKCQWPHRPCYINPLYEPEWYVGGSLGFQEPDDWQIQTSASRLEIDPDGGWEGTAVFGAASGLTYAGRRRVEAEFGVRTNDVDKLTFDNLNFAFDGDVTVYSGMVNVLWDFKHRDRDWYPYVGVGAGIAEINFEHDLPGFTSDEFHDRVFAWQLIGGVSWRARPWMEMFADVRYFSTSTPEFDVTLGQDLTTPATGLLLPAGRQSLRSEYHTFGSMFGVRFLLGKRYCPDALTFDGRPTSGGGWAFRGN